MHKDSNPRAGSVLVTAIIFGIALVIAAGGYIHLSGQSLRMANRTFHLNSAMNLAEAGIEEGLYALNTFQGSSSAPKNYAAFPTGGAKDWYLNIDGDGDGAAVDAKRTFSYFKSNQVTTGEFTVIVTKWELLTPSTRPTIIVRARSSIANAAVDDKIEKIVRATISRRSLFAGGLVSRREIRFNGNTASVDSYNSKLGPYEPDLPTLGVKDMAEDLPANGGNNDGIVNRFGNATVASASVGVNLGNADVWGYVYTNGSTPSVGPNGSIAELGTTQGTVDPSRVSTDFQANFPVVETPAIPPGAITALPTKVGNVYTLGTVGATTPTVYSLSGNINLTGSEVIQIVGPVRIHHSGAIRATSTNAGIMVDAMPLLFDSSPEPQLNDPNVPPFQLWISGNLTLIGMGLDNPSKNGSSVQIYGTAPPPIPPSTTGTQTMDIKGGGTLTASVYAPNADLTIVGGGDVFGSFTANSVTVSGNAAFHYDERTKDKGTGKYGLALWRELTTPAQRAGTGTGYSW